jgi:predicted dehydrogenase
MKKIVVVGCGAVLELCHRKALEQVAKRLGFRVVGLVDPNPGRLSQAQKWFPGAGGFADTEACFSKLSDILLTVVTSPPPLHAANVESAFSRGSHVLCEKPLAGSVADAERIVAAAKRSGKVLSLGMTRRFYSCLVEARRRIMVGALGTKLTFIYREGGVYGWPVASAAPFRRQSSGGGVLLDKGVHALDSLSFLFGSGKVMANADDGPIESVEANTVTELQFERAAGTMQLSWDMNLSNGLHIRGSEGEYWLPIGPLDLLFSRGSPDAEWRQEKVRVEWPLDLELKNGKRGYPIDYNECFVFQLVQTLRAIQLGEAPAAAGEEGLATMRLISAAYDVAVPLNKPWLPAAEQALEKERHWRKQCTRPVRNS